ncbi:acetolactate synthase small subunit [Halospeciosus flavus]|uniref:Acetolactate synthase small subunit n=1 Tax=Halospeciosus flavus TaxID=3032283 RepID=A0ABD5Z8G6_9EURY|nr:acetolactate synthase small subunit [Halospeciosus flavus]
MTGELPGPAPEERPRPEGRRTKQGIRINPEAEAQPEVCREVLTALVDHEPGVLADVSGLFARRQFNIESLTVGPTTQEGLARMTIVVEEDEPGVEQVKRQLRKELHVRSVRELDGAVERELALIKVDGDDPAGVSSVAEMYGGEAVEAGADVITVELTGTEAEIDAAISAFERFGVREVARTGTAALAHGTENTV